MAGGELAGERLDAGAVREPRQEHVRHQANRHARSLELFDGGRDMLPPQ